MILYRFPDLLAEEEARCWVKNETRLKIPWMQWLFKHEFAHHILSFVNTIGPKNNIQARKIDSQVIFLGTYIIISSQNPKKSIWKVKSSIQSEFEHVVLATEILRLA